MFQEGTGGSGFLNMYWSRVQDPTGTTNMDFEFNQKRCTGTDQTGCSTNGITPTRATGDLLVIYDLSQGGTHPTLLLRTWSATASAWGAPVDLTGSGTATGSINSSSIPAVDADGLGLHSPRTLGEAQLDLSAVFTSPACLSFGLVYLKSRSSDSFTAAVKDFVAPEPITVTNCVQPTLTTGQSSVPNDSTTVTVPAGRGNLDGYVVFELFPSVDCAGTADYTSDHVPVSGGLTQTVSSSNETACTADTSFSWKVSYTSNIAAHNSIPATCTEHSSITVNNGG